MNNNINCNIIVCGPAIGKTYLASIDDNFIDLDALKAIYKYGLENASSFELEHGKLQRGKTIREDSFAYIIKIIEKTIQDDKIGLLSFNAKIIDYLVKNNIPYCLVYPVKDSRLEIAKRMQERGNTQEFIKQMTDEEIWNNFYYENTHDTKPHIKIELKKGQYLSDIKDYFIKEKDNIFADNRYQLRKATFEDLLKVKEYKLSTILKYADDLDEEEITKIKNYIEREIPKQIDDIKLITFNKEIIGCFIVTSLDDGLLLDEIYLEEEYRGCCIGTKLINSILDQKVYLWVYKSNKGAIKLYKKLGFKILDETETRYYMVHNKK